MVRLTSQSLAPQCRVFRCRIILRTVSKSPTTISARVGGIARPAQDKQHIRATRNDERAMRSECEPCILCTVVGRTTN